MSREKEAAAIVYGNTEPVDFRKWNVRKLVDDMYEREKARISESGFRPATLPPMSANWWRTVDEETFRQLLRSNMRIMCSLDAWDAIKERAVSLGIRL
jgi:hypothetical protein